MSAESRLPESTRRCGPAFASESMRPLHFGAQRSESSIFSQETAWTALPWIALPHWSCQKTKMSIGTRHSELKKQSCSTFRTASHALSPPAGWTWIWAEWLLSVRQPWSRKTMRLIWRGTPQQRSAHRDFRIGTWNHCSKVKLEMHHETTFAKCLANRDSSVQEPSAGTLSALHKTCARKKWNVKAKPATSWANLSSAATLIEEKTRVWSEISSPFCFIPFQSTTAVSAIQLTLAPDLHTMWLGFHLLYYNSNTRKEKSEIEESKIWWRVDQKKQGAFPSISIVPKCIHVWFGRFKLCSANPSQWFQS